MDARTGKPGDTFTYAIPSHMHVEPGHLVLVPFGPRRLHGVVTGLLVEPNVDYTRPIASVVEEQPVLTPERIELGRWIASYYRASLFDALAPMLPPGMRGAAHTYVQAAPDPAPGAGERLSGGARRLLAYLRANPRPHRIATLTATLGPWVRNAVRALVEAGEASEWLSEPRHSRTRYEGPGLPPRPPPPRCVNSPGTSRVRRAALRCCVNLHAHRRGCRRRTRGSDSAGLR